jgi:prepilin-type N-terminal cleavage/methylation domain-containing protein
MSNPREMGTARSSVERGFSLIEVMFALGILLVVSLGLLPLGVIATTVTENEGHLVSRTAEYAQDKLEQLLALSYGDSTTDTRVFPATNTGGTGLAVGGSSNPAAPVALYVDYLNIDGTLIPSSGTTPPAGWFYKRVWQVSLPAGTTNLKQVTVTATVVSLLTES